jgi:hypothetical protein
MMEPLPITDCIISYAILHMLRVAHFSKLKTKYNLTLINS